MTKTESAIKKTYQSLHTGQSAKKESSGAALFFKPVLTSAVQFWESA